MRTVETLSLWFCRHCIHMSHPFTYSWTYIFMNICMHITISSTALHGVCITKEPPSSSAPPLSAAAIHGSQAALSDPLHGAVAAESRITM